MGRPDLVIFDCDGVLVDSELIDARIRSECLRAEGFAVTPQELAEHPGISGADLVAMIERRFGRPLPEGFMKNTRAKIMSVFTDELKAIDGVCELLGSLDMPVCVATNSHTDRVRHSLEVTGLWRFFEPHVFSATMVSRGKPAPDLFLFAAERRDVSRANCLVVEDSTHGIMAAQAAGMEVVGFCGGSHCRIGHGERLLGAGCRQVFARMSELGEFLHSLDPQPATHLPPCPTKA
jgi:HAD superfamily hydrolase (TIGR01509 family)